MQKADEQSKDPFPVPQEEQGKQQVESTSSNQPPSIPKGISRVMYGYGHFVYRVRWFLLAFWIVGVLASIPFALKAPSVLQGGGYFNITSESVDVEHILNQKLHQPLSDVVVAFQSATTLVGDPVYQQEIKNFASRAKGFPYATSVIVGGVGKDGRTTYVEVGFNHDPDFMQREMPTFRTLLPSQNAANPAHAYLTGTPAIYDTLTRITNTDVERADSIALPIALVGLLLVFATVVAAMMPLLLGVTAVSVALAIIYAVALSTPTTSFILSVASIIGLGISIDYSLLITRRYREELALSQLQEKGNTPSAIREAIGRTIATAGEAILFSGSTVIIGFLGLLLIGVQITTSFAIGGAVIVAVAVLAALTLLPALLSILGTRINALRLPMPGRRTSHTHQLATTLATIDTQPTSKSGNKPSFWHSWALVVMRHPGKTILGVIVLLFLLGWPAFSLNVGIPGADVLPSNTEERQSLAILQRQFPDLLQNPIYLVAQTSDSSGILTDANLARVDHLSQWITSQPHITSTISLTTMPATPGMPMPSTAQLIGLYSSGTYKHIPALNQLVSSTTVGDTTVLIVTSNTTLDSNEGKALIDHLRTASMKPAQGLHIRVGGLQALSLDLDRALYRNFPQMIFFILVATYLLLLLMFRSVLLPLKAVLMNTLSVAVTYGALVFVFQWGNFGFTHVAFIDAITPILLFCILFGLSMDYEVFLLSRIREEWLRTQNNQVAVVYGLEKTAGVISSAALLFVIVTGAFAFTSLVTTQEIGVGMTVAILVDATIIRLLLVPAMMRLLGRWNWWLPGRPLPPRQSKGTL
ncbi:MAG: MMPL family transporter [Chloroflexota bacterium]|nr:MMPL family transporter [Chloroflexota bacterium]